MQQRLIEVLRASPLTLITWGDTASPFYEQVPEPAPGYPYVVLEFENSEIDHNFKKGYQEKYTITVAVVGVESNIQLVGSPYWDQSVLWYLDTFNENPGFFSGEGFECAEFLRHSWHLKQSEIRAPSGERVWEAVGVYGSWVNVPYPKLP